MKQQIVLHRHRHTASRIDDDTPDDRGALYVGWTRGVVRGEWTDDGFTGYSAAHIVAIERATDAAFRINPAGQLRRRRGS